MATVIGLNKLQKKLKALPPALAKKALRSAVSRAATPIKRRMKSAAPKGTQSHKTYKGRLVAPGFGSRQIVSRSKFYPSTGSAVATIGVRREAFYLIQFYDSRPGRTNYTISKRKYSRGGRQRRRVVAVKPYTLKAKPWFSQLFIDDRKRIEKDIGRFLGQRIEKLARGN